MHLRRIHNVSILFITHDLPLVSNISDRILIMNEGELVEEGSTEEVITGRKPFIPDGSLTQYADDLKRQADDSSRENGSLPGLLFLYIVKPLSVVTFMSNCRKRFLVAC